MSFVSPRTLRVEGEKNSLFPVGPVIKCFVIPPNSKIEKLYTFSHDCKKIIFLTPAGTQICPVFKVHDVITCESKVQ